MHVQQSSVHTTLWPATHRHQRLGSTPGPAVCNVAHKLGGVRGRLCPSGVTTPAQSQRRKDHNRSAAPGRTCISSCGSAAAALQDRNAALRAWTSDSEHAR